MNQQEAIAEVVLVVSIIQHNSLKIFSPNISGGTTQSTEEVYKFDDKNINYPNDYDICFPSDKKKDKIEKARTLEW